MTETPECPICSLRFRSDAELRDHMLLDHPDVDLPDHLK